MKMNRMKQLFNVVLILLVSSISLACSKDDEASSSSLNGDVDYEFTLIFDGTVYKIKGNTKDDPGYRGPIVNYCFATNGSGGFGIELSIQDVTWHNYVDGNPFKCKMFASSPSTTGIKLMDVDLFFNGYYYSYYVKYNVNPGASGGGDNRLPINLTDLGTPVTGTIGSSDVKFGTTVKGNYSGIVYTVPSYSNNATTPHNLSIDFKVVRRY